MNDSENTKPQSAHRPSRLPSTRAILGLTFGIFMIFIYVGMGVLLLINFFGWYAPNPLAWIRWLIGPLLIAYGFSRGWRMYKFFTQPQEEDDENE